MNTIEKQMTVILRTLRLSFGAVAVKASMEAEGILLNEMLRLKDVATAAGVGMSVKIGGCEAVTDARIARAYGASILLGPMIESRFALEKFLGMAESVFSEDEREETKFYINIETMDGYRKLDEILMAGNLPFLHAIVLGRSDLRNTLKVETVDCPEMLRVAEETFRKAKEKSLHCIVGGGITEKTVPFLEELRGLADGFETRKVVFDSDAKDSKQTREAIRLALRFEYLWYQLRRQMYLRMYQEDVANMKKIETMLEDLPTAE